jgi:hypothetical protein
MNGTLILLGLGVFIKITPCLSMTIRLAAAFAVIK